MRDQALGRNQGGFSLIETMMALAITGVLLSSINGFLNNQQKAYFLQEQIVEVQEGLRIASTIMERDLRTAGYDPIGTANAGIVVADRHSIHLTRDLNGDGDTTDSNEDIRYALYSSDGNNTLGRFNGPYKNPVLEYTESLEFAYRKADGTLLTSDPITDPSQIRKIKITIVAKTAHADPKYPKNNGYRTRALTTSVSIRN